MKALCKQFDIDNTTCITLHDAMKISENYDQDLQALHMVVQHAVGKGKKPLEVILTQIRALRANRFPGKMLLGKDSLAVSEKYNLDSSTAAPGSEQPTPACLRSSGWEMWSHIVDMYIAKYPDLDDSDFEDLLMARHLTVHEP